MVLICWAMVVFDGYDLVVYGTVVPSLLADPAWEVTPATLGLVGSLAFLGMFAGALASGSLADRWGRRRTVLTSFLCFSLFTAACALATGPLSLGVLRFLAGTGLGALIPAVSALVNEVAGLRRRSLISAAMLSGVPVGGSVAAVLGAPVIALAGWPGMFWLALAGPLIVFPLALSLLPESPVPPRASRAVDKVRELLGDGRRRAAILFPLTAFVTLFSWYGLMTWLPKMMIDQGFRLGSSLTFLLVLSLGAAAGAIVVAGFARRSPTGMASVLCGLASAALIGLAVLPAGTLTYPLLLVVGVGTHGTQCLVVAAVAIYYRDELRASGLAWMLGLGRLGAVAAPAVGGVILAAGPGVRASFLLFAATTAAGMVLLAFSSRLDRTGDLEIVSTDEGADVHVRSRTPR